MDRHRVQCLTLDDSGSRCQAWFNLRTVELGSTTHVHPASLECLSCFRMYSEQELLELCTKPQTTPFGGL